MPSSLMVVAQEIADHVLRLSGGRGLTVSVADPDEPALLEVRVAAGVGSAELVGRSFPKRSSAAGSAMVRDRGWCATTAELDVLRAPGDSASLGGPVLAVPVRMGSGRPVGAIVVYRLSGELPFDAIDLAMAEDFARQTSLAIELAESRSRGDWRQQRTEHEQFAQQLHEDLLQRLFAIGMTVQRAQVELQVEESVSARRAEPHLGRAVDDLNAVIRDVRATPSSRSREPAAVSLRRTAAEDAACIAEQAVATAADRAAVAASTARAHRSAAVERAAEAVAARVLEAAAAVESEADLAALTVAQAAFDAAFLIASSVAPGSERDAALTATLVATAVSAIAIKTAAVTAAARAEVAREAAAAADAAAVAAADAERIVDLEVACAAEAVRAVAAEAALVLAERGTAAATAFAAARL